VVNRAHVPGIFRREALENSLCSVCASIVDRDDLPGKRYFGQEPLGFAHEIFDMSLFVQSRKEKG
jgi:hypothetical protein